MPSFHSNFKFKLGLLSGEWHINVTMVAYIKGDIFCVNRNVFNYNYFKFLLTDFNFFFKYLRSLTCQ